MVIFQKFQSLFYSRVQQLYGLTTDRINESRVVVVLIQVGETDGAKFCRTCPACHFPTGVVVAPFSNWSVGGIGAGERSYHGDTVLVETLRTVAGHYIIIVLHTCGGNSLIKEQQAGIIDKFRICDIAGHSQIIISSARSGGYPILYSIYECSIIKLS